MKNQKNLKKNIIININKNLRSNKQNQTEKKERKQDLDMFSSCSSSKDIPFNLETDASIENFEEKMISSDSTVLIPSESYSEEINEESSSDESYIGINKEGSSRLYPTFEGSRFNIIEDILLKIFENNQLEDLHNFCDFSFETLTKLFCRTNKKKYIITCLQQFGCTNRYTYTLIDLFIFCYYFKINIQYINIFGHLQRIFRVIRK